MASRSLCTKNKLNENSGSLDMSYYNESIIMNIEDQNFDSNKSWFNSFVRSFDTSRIHPFDSSWIELKDNSINNIYQLFTFIDLSRFLILCIKRENDSITSMDSFSYKSAINFHKIREIDFMKLLIVIRDRIELLADIIHNNDFYFSKEVSIGLEELDNIFKDCFFSQINDIDVTEKFNLSSMIVDTILDDCNVDLLDLDKNIVRIHQEWTKKSQQGRLSKGRLSRLVTQIIDSLQDDVIKHLHTVGITLERLLNGYSSNVFNVFPIELTKEFMLEFHTEIDGRQYQNIVHLKHFHLELEQKAFILILGLKEEQLTANHTEPNNPDINFFGRMSPIKSAASFAYSTPLSRRGPSLLTSTPSPAHYANLIAPKFTADYEDLTSESDEPSVLSLDSGILPISENATSVANSIDTLDVAPFSETVNGFENYDCSKKVNDEDSDCFGSTSICSENDANMSPSTNFSLISVVDSSTSFKSEQEEQLDGISTSLNFKNGIRGFENYEEVMHYLEIPMKQQEVMRQKIRRLFVYKETNSKFNCALSVTMFQSRNQQPNDLEMTLAHLEHMFYDFMRTDIQEMSINQSWNSNLDIQNNNSACSPNCVSTFNSDITSNTDQNTNNNADSKEDDTSDLNTAADDLAINVSVYGDSGQLLPMATSSIIMDSQSRDISGSADDADSLQYDVLIAQRYQAVGDDQSNGSLILEDIDLALKLSELHLRKEFESEHLKGHQATEGRWKLVRQYKDTTTKVVTEIKRSGSDNRHSEDGEWMNYVNQVCDTIEEIDDELKTECISAAIVDISIDDSGSGDPGPSTYDNPEVDKSSLAKDVSHDNDSLTFHDRITLTVTLTGRLLALSRDRLEQVSSSMKGSDRNSLSKIATSKMPLIYSIRQRLSMVSKIISNLKYSILCSYYPESNPDPISDIDELLTESDKISKFSFKLEDWIHRCDLAIDNIEDASYIYELPDNLLVKLDPIDTDSIVLMSNHRLLVTVSALKQYPCYEKLMKYSLSTKIGLENIVATKKLLRDVATPRSSSELTVEIHKLRRITAICALNIVDLHVIIAKIDEGFIADYDKKVAELKELLRFWRVVDKECHRLLRCNSLIQHVLVDTRRTYVELVSLTAVMISIMRTVSLSTHQISIFNQHMDNIHSYKLKLVEWLDEVELCSSVVHKKRITNRRFKFYEDIHSYLEENLSSVSVLANHIKLGCHETVKSLTEVLTYCSDLSSTSVTAIDSMLCTNIVMDNREFKTNINGNNQINDKILGAMANLETVENNVSRLHDLLDQSKEMFFIVSGNNQEFKTQQNDASVEGYVETEPRYKKRNQKEAHILEMATFNLTEKISEIATFAASNALLLFANKPGLAKNSDADTDQQMSNWTSLSQNDQYLDEAVDQIVDDISAMMTASLFEQMLSVDDRNPMLSSRLVFGDICRQLRDRTLEFLIETILFNGQNQDGFACESGCDVAEYFTEELSRLLIDDCVNNVTMVTQSSSTSNPSVELCIIKLQRRVSQKLLDKTVNYIADFVGTFIDQSQSSLDMVQEKSSDQHITEHLLDLPLPVSTYRLWKKSNQELIGPEEILIKMTRMLQTDLLSLKTYRCDIRKSTTVERFCNFVPKNFYRNDPLTSRITSEKISKLVAQFNQGSVQSGVTEATVLRIASKSVQKKYNDIASELIDETVEEFQIKMKGTENLEEKEVEEDGVDEKYETISEIEDTVECIADLIIGPSNAYSSEAISVDRVQFCDVKKFISEKPTSKCEMGYSRNFRTELNNQCTLSVSETVGDNSRVVDSIRSNGLPVTLSLDSSADVDSLKCDLTIVNNYSPMTISIGSGGGDHVTENDELSLSSDYDSNDTVVSIEETNDSLTETLITQSAFSGQRIVNSGEIVERFRSRYNTENEVDEYQMVRKSRDGSIDAEWGDIRMREVSNHGVTGEHNAHNNMAPARDYEQSLSRLWLLVFAIIVMILLSMVCHDQIRTICRCVSSGRLLWPKVISSGLPF